MMSLGRATIFCTQCAGSCQRASNGTETRTRIVNSRNARRNAQALVGLHAFVRVLPCSGDLPMGRVPDHLKSENHSDPGGRRV